MNKGIRPIKKLECSSPPVADIGTGQKPLLYSPFNPPRIIGDTAHACDSRLELKNRCAVALGNIPETLAATVPMTCNIYRPAIDYQRNDPIKHLHEKGEFLQNSRVDISRKAARVGRAKGPSSEYPARLGRVEGGEIFGSVPVAG